VPSTAPQYHECRSAEVVHRERFSRPRLSGWHRNSPNRWTRLFPQDGCSNQRRGVDLHGISSILAHVNSAVNRRWAVVLLEYSYRLFECNLLAVFLCPQYSCLLSSALTHLRVSNSGSASGLLQFPQTSSLTCMIDHLARLQELAIMIRNAKWDNRDVVPSSYSQDIYITILHGSVIDTRCPLSFPILRIGSCTQLVQTDPKSPLSILWLHHFSCRSKASA
jgi:hypothetical protein